MSVTPAIKKVVSECVDSRLGIHPTLTAVLVHARGHGNAIRFEDAVEITELYLEQRLGMSPARSASKTSEFIFTFGFGQQLPGGAAADSCYARVQAPDFEAARERMVATFGRRWSFQYTSAEEAGVERFRLKEVAFLPWPGPMLADIPEEVRP